MEESGKQQELVLYKILHYFVPDYLHFGCMVLENVISTKHYFQLEEITSQREYKIQNPKHYFQLEEIAANLSTEFKTIDVILMCLEILLHKHKAVIKVPGIAKQTVNRK